MSPSRNPYFFGIALVLFILVFAGFSPTFYLRPFFDRPDRVGSAQLPIHLIFHGLALTSWYTIFCIQTWLVYKNRTSTHRNLGIYGFVAAICTVISGFIVLAKFYPRTIAAGINLAVPLENIGRLIVGQSINLSVFLLCVVTAIHYRKRTEIHKRLMLIGSIIIMGAALSENRMFGAAVQEMLPFSFGIAVHIMLVVSLLVYDGMVHKKVFPISLIGGAYILGRPFFLSLIAQSEAGTSYYTWLGGFPVH